MPSVPSTSISFGSESPTSERTARRLATAGLMPVTRILLDTLAVTWSFLTLSLAWSGWHWIVSGSFGRRRNEIIVSSVADDRPTLKGVIEDSGIRSENFDKTASLGAGPDECSDTR